jgi:hypothetical protein
VFVILSGTVLAADTDPADLPWKKLYGNFGWYFAGLDSTVRLGESNLGLGIDLSVEEFLDLDSSGGAFRFEGGWRFSKNKRHKMELGWYAFHRSGTKTIDNPVTLPPELGGGTIGPGTYNTTFDFDIIKVKYEYSFLLDDRVDFNIGAGLFVMPFKVGILVDTSGVGTSQLQESITAPLPVISMGFDIALTPKWFIRQQLDLFYLEISDFKGGIADIQLALEYLPWKNFGFGLGLDSLTVKVEAENSDVPGVDFSGDIGFDTTGVQLYVKAFF